MDGGQSKVPLGSFDSSNAPPSSPTQQQLYHLQITSDGLGDGLSSTRITDAEYNDAIQELLQQELTNSSAKTRNMDLTHIPQADAADDSGGNTVDDFNFGDVDDLNIFTGIFDREDQNIAQVSMTTASVLTGPDPSNNQPQRPHETTDGECIVNNEASSQENNHRSPSAMEVLGIVNTPHQSVAESDGRHDHLEGNGDYTQSSKRPVPHDYALSSPTLKNFLGLDIASSSFGEQDPTEPNHDIPDEADNVAPGGFMLPNLICIGSQPEKWCPACGHQGHGGINFTGCPTGRLVRYIKSKGTEEYAVMHKADGIFLYVDDRYRLIDGMTFLACSLQDNKCADSTHRLKQTGAKLMRTLFKVLKEPQPGEFILPADPAQNPERSIMQTPAHPLTANFFNLVISESQAEPTPFEDWVNYNVAIIAFHFDDDDAIRAFNEAYAWFQDSLELARLRGEDFNPGVSNFMETNIISEMSPGYIEVHSPDDPRDGDYSPDLDPNEESKEKTRGSKVNVPESTRTKYRRGIDTSIYEGIETEILGGRASVRCSTCIMRGHTLTATKTCPVGMLDRALNCASARTKVQWANLKPKADKACKQLEKVIALLDSFPDEKARLEKKIAEYRALDSATGRPRYAPIKGYVLKVARKDALKALEENPDPLANLPLSKYTPEQIKDYIFPDLVGLGVKPSFPPVDWESIWRPDVPRDMIVRSVCQLENIGDRPDTHCMLCLHYGHDSRSKSCLVQIVRQVFLNPTAHGISKAKEILDVQLRHAFYWQQIVPSDQKKDTGNITEVFQTYLDHKKEHEDKQMELLSGRYNKRQKITHQLGSETPYAFNNMFPGNGGWGAQLGPPPTRQASYQSPISSYPSSLRPQGGLPQTAATQPQAAQLGSPASSPSSQRPTQGTLIDHTKLQGDQFARIFPYVINDGNNYGGLVVNFSAMPVQLVLELIPCVIHGTEAEESA